MVVFVKRKTEDVNKTTKPEVKTPKFISDKTIIVSLPTFSSIERFNQILDNFDSVTKLHAVCNKNVLASGNSIKVKINIEFPENNLFDVDSAYMYLVSLLCSAGIDNKLVGDDNKPIADCMVSRDPTIKRQTSDNNPAAKLLCIINGERSNYEFDIIISVIETVHDISIEIIRDFSERTADGFKREVLISVPNSVVLDLVSVLEKRSFHNINERNANHES